MTGDVFAYHKMQAYYRNIALWLAGLEQRRSVLVAGVWGALIGSWPGFYSDNQDAWDMGERTLGVLASTMSPCGIEEVVAAFLDVRTRSLQHLSGDITFAPRWEDKRRPPISGRRRAFSATTRRVARFHPQVSAAVAGDRSL